MEDEGFFMAPNVVVTRCEIVPLSIMMKIRPHKGMVLSWSNVCDKGVGHVNCKSEDQVIGMMRAEAFDYDAKATSVLRNVTAWGYLKTTLMVFRRA